MHCWIIWPLLFFFRSSSSAAFSSPPALFTYISTARNTTTRVDRGHGAGLVLASRGTSQPRHRLPPGHQRPRLLHGAATARRLPALAADPRSNQHDPCFRPTGWVNAGRRQVLLQVQQRRRRHAPLRQLRHRPLHRRSLPLLRDYIFITTTAAGHARPQPLHRHPDHLRGANAD